MRPFLSILLTFSSRSTALHICLQARLGVEGSGENSSLNGTEEPISNTRQSGERSAHLKYAGRCRKDAGCESFVPIPYLGGKPVATCVCDNRFALERVKSRANHDRDERTMCLGGREGRSVRVSGVA